MKGRIEILKIMNIIFGIAYYTKEKDNERQTWAPELLIHSNSELTLDTMQSSVLVQTYQGFAKKKLSTQTDFAIYVCKEGLN